jgi:hypothetical protein
MNMTKKMSAQQNVADPPKNVLYVVLHGLVCLIDDNRESFTADLVDMGAEHAYLCGDFLFEDVIASGAELTLNGVDPPRPKSSENQLNTDSNAVVRLGQHMPDLDNYYHSRIHLPRPIRIDYYIVGDLIKGSLDDTKNELVGPPTSISGIRVSKYSFADYKDVRLTTQSGEEFWRCPKLVPVKDENVAVLHVFNEPPSELANAGKHNKDEFNFTLAYQGAQLRLTSPATQPAKNGRPPDGMLPEELCALDTRHEMVQKLINSLRPYGSDSKRPVVFTPDDTKGGAGGTQVCGGSNGLIGG